MLVPGDLGFRVAVVFIFVVFPAIFLFLRRQWRIAVARKEEINRLLVLASEEAAQAEIEASFGYSVSSTTSFVSVSNSQRLCAVCFTPTQNRCARCKSVHYCSGKCQIIHWRQGHKYECSPLTSFEDDESINFAKNTVKQPYVDDYYGSNANDAINFVSEVDTAESDHVPSSSVLTVKDDNNTASSADEENLSEVHGFSVSSEVRQSVSTDGMCIESTSDDDSLHDLNSDSCDSSSSYDNPGAAVSDRTVQEMKPEIAHTKVKRDGHVSASAGFQEGAFDKGIDALVFTIHSNKKSVEPIVPTSGFWDGSLDCSRIRNGTSGCNTKPKFGDSVHRKSFDFTSLQPASHLPGSLSSDMHTQSTEASPHSHPEPLKASKLVEPTLPDKEYSDPAKRKSSSVLRQRRLETRVKENNIQEDLMMSEESRTVGDTSRNNDLPSYSTRVANVLHKDSKGPSSPSTSKKAGWSSEVSNVSSSHVISGNIVSPIKSLKADSNGDITPQMTSSTPSAAVGVKTSVMKVVEQLKAPRLSKQGVGKTIEKGIFPYDLFVKLYHWNKVERPFGLINCGNSCYANVVLQCLAFTPPLTAYLCQGLHSKACVSKEWCFLCEYERLILKGKEAGSSVSPIGILSQIQKIGSHLANGREEDAHEFLRYSIDTMQSICLREARASSSSSLEEETTLVGLTFGGFLRSKIQCTRCHGKSERQERMMDLTVEIGGDIETLEDALRQFTGTESLDGENKYHCGRCNSYEKAKKKLNISEAPNVLTVALKRFQSGKFGKLNKSIRFPEVLNLAPYMRGSSDKSPVYRLYGVVVHLDIMNASFSGHYVCYVRNTQSKWYKIDDSVVKIVEPERVLNKGAYMLFYSRCSPRAPKSIRTNIMSRDVSSKMKNAEVDSSWTKGRSTSRHRDLSVDTNHTPDDLANLGYVHLDETRRMPHILEFDSSSDNSSLFSHSDEVSSSTDSTRESISADDFSDYIFGYNGPWRLPSDSDTSSSSSSCSSSPLCTKHSPLSHSERYTSALSEPTVLQTGKVMTSCETCKAEELGSRVGVPFLQSNSSSKQVRKVVNSSSHRGADSHILGRANPLDNMMSGVRLRSSSKKTG